MSKTISDREYRRLKRIEKAARGVIDAVNKNLDTEPPPHKWTAPWGALTKLVSALES